MAKYIVTYTGANGVKAYAAGMDIEGNYLYSFSIEESVPYDWQADAMNAVRDRANDWALFIHNNSDTFAIEGSRMNLEYYKLEA